MATYKYFRVLCQRLPKDPEQQPKLSEESPQQQQPKGERPFPGRLVVQDSFATVYTYKGSAMGTFEFTEHTGAPSVGAEYVFRGGGREVRVRVAEELLLDSHTFVPFGRAVCRLVREDGFPGLKFTERTVGVRTVRPIHSLSALFVPFSSRAMAAFTSLRLPLRGVREVLPAGRAAPGARPGALGVGGEGVAEAHPGHPGVRRGLRGLPAGLPALQPMPRPGGGLFG